MIKVAVIHDWLTVYAGSERVLEQILLCYPDAILFSVIDFLPNEQRSFIEGRRPLTTFIQRLPLASTKYRSYLPLMPLAVEQLDLSGYDIVISSNHAVAKGVLTGPDQLHISYVHSPMRYAWDLQHQYLRESNFGYGIKGMLVRWVLHFLRLWDVCAASRVDTYIANSHFIARRIMKIYKRDSQVIHPPVDIENFGFRERKEDFYFTVSRMVPYKRMDLIVDAFSQMPHRRLVIIGDGPEFKKIQNKAGPNIQLLGYQPLPILRDHLQRARAFVFAAEEDFGIAPVEAQACGTPVIAFGKGGVLETIRGLDVENPTGVFFFEQTQLAIVKAVDEFERRQSEISPQACRNNALRFSPERFRKEFSALLEREWSRFAKESGRRSDSLTVQRGSMP